MESETAAWNRLGNDEIQEVIDAWHGRRKRQHRNSSVQKNIDGTQNLLQKEYDTEQKREYMADAVRG